MIRRCTTPTHRYTLWFEPPQGTKFCIVYSQGEQYKEEVLFECCGERITVDGNRLIVTLTVEETAKFDCTPVWVNGKFAPLPVAIQIGFKTLGGQQKWCDVIYTTVGRCLKKDGVISG